MTTLTDLKRPSFAPVPCPAPLQSAQFLLVGCSSWQVYSPCCSSPNWLWPTPPIPADPLRHIIGNDAVAQLETWLFTAQDAANSSPTKSVWLKPKPLAGGGRCFANGCCCVNGRSHPYPHPAHTHTHQPAPSLFW
ncbi:MAG: hypothetical protein H6658_12975 [Ardenticatenaceae bacterium]|nr:hypothetical protein [Ardenticatenaceae bacterium]